jgi:hypothetical protein
MVNYSSTNRFGSRSTTNDRNVKSNFHPRDEWDKLTQDQKDKIVAKRRQEKEASKSSQSSRQVNLHEVENLVNIDDIFEYVTMKHDLVTEDISSDEAHPGDNLLLEHMAGQGLDNSPGDIGKVLDSNRKPQKN